MIRIQNASSLISIAGLYLADLTRQNPALCRTSVGVTDAGTDQTSQSALLTATIYQRTGCEFVSTGDMAARGHLVCVALAMCLATLPLGLAARAGQEPFGLEHSPLAG